MKYYMLMVFFGSCRDWRRHVVIKNLTCCMPFAMFLLAVTLTLAVNVIYSICASTTTTSSLSPPLALGKNRNKIKWKRKLLLPFSLSPCVRIYICKQWQPQRVYIWPNGNAKETSSAVSSRHRLWTTLVGVQKHPPSTHTNTRAHTHTSHWKCVECSASPSHSSTSIVCDFIDGVHIMTEYGVFYSQSIPIYCTEQNRRRPKQFSAVYHRHHHPLRRISLSLSSSLSNSIRVYHGRCACSAFRVDC